MARLHSFWGIDPAELSACDLTAEAQAAAEGRSERQAYRALAAKDAAVEAAIYATGEDDL